MSSVTPPPMATRCAPSRHPRRDELADEPHHLIYRLSGLASLQLDQAQVERMGCKVFADPPSVELRDGTVYFDDVPDRVGRGATASASAPFAGSRIS